MRPHLDYTIAPLEFIGSWQNEDAASLLRMYDTSGLDALIDHIAQWHQPGTHAIRPRLGRSDADNILIRWGYIIVANAHEGHNYIGFYAARCPYCQTGNVRVYGGETHFPESILAGQCQNCNRYFDVM